ncbi:MAG: hypothetical protein ABI585_10065 [Betaproteobacteria bacterium]
MVKKLAALLVLAGFALGLSACNTIGGVGADVAAGGNAIENAAEKAKPR